MTAPDLTTLAGYVRNRISTGQPATIVLEGRRVHIIPNAVLGQDLPGMLVASDRGESLWVEPKTNLGVTAFVAGGFTMSRARTLARLFQTIRERRNKSLRG